MIPDGLQYFSEHFWNDQKCDQIWLLGPRIYNQNISKIHKWSVHPENPEIMEFGDWGF